MENRTYHHGNLREALIDAGVALARTGGPSAVVLRAVSREAGVSHNAAYRHFADHQDLLAAVAVRCMERLGLLMVRRTAEVAEDDPVPRAWARLAAIGRAYVDFALTEHGWFRTAFSGAAAHGAKHVLGDPDASRTDPYTLLAARLDELVEVGELPPERRPGAEYAAWSAVHGLSDLLVDGPLHELPAGEVGFAVETVLAAIARGL
ncbi:TetR/AcrR family transcriptional regulator [Streptomyces sp. NRRL B-24484]|uniref:TetR/AcrR family transcriptional regulator n=1 Tax=Streptomyces sp. NRRL B-24484 TaxID=1463833 RepID=UPI0005B7731E|nr:TetR/AcrR family transcriptional regulator [Streptomyces sp. NRRL B-24484]